MKRILTVLAIIVSLTLSTTVLLAQQTNVGNISGTVDDASGAVVPGAEVFATNQGTNVMYPAVTTSAGVYFINRLPVGTYTVSVAKTGFKKVTRPDLQVLSGQTSTANITLQVGATTETITVTGDATAINTTDTNQGTTRTLAELQALPIGLYGNAARAAVSAVQSMSGVNYNLKGGSGQSWMVVAEARINGIDGSGVGYEIDGVQSGLGDPEQGVDFIAPVPEAIGEIRLTNNTDSSQGFAAGQSIAMISKSGTNDFHGGVYYYNKNDALMARSWFLNNRFKDNQNQGGWYLGGPLIIPNVYNGRNKTFFFATMDVFRYVTNAATVQNSVAVASVPTMSNRSGDFRDQLGAQVGTDALGRPAFQNEIYDPATTRSVTQGVVDPVSGLTATSSGFIRDPFAFGGNLNVIDPARLSSVSQNFVTGYVAPTGPGVASNWTGAYGRSVVPKQQWSVKIDQVIGNSMRFMFSTERQFEWFFPDFPADCPGGHVRYSGSVGYTNDVLAYAGSADCRQSFRYRFAYSWTLAPELLFSLRGGVNGEPKRNQISIPEAAANGGCAAGLQAVLNCRTPTVNIQNLSSFGPTNSGLFAPHTYRIPINADLAWTKGKHLIGFGASYVTAPILYQVTANNYGTFNFNQAETGLPGTTVATRTGLGVASFMLGAVDASTLNYPRRGRLNTSGIGFYGQDKWRATNKLTLTYGLRWEITPPAHEHENRIGTLDPSKPNPAAGNILGALSIYGFGPGRNGLDQVGTYYLNAFAPKVGLAYAYNEKTVFRANYGMSYFPYWTKWLGGITGSILPQDGFSQNLNPVTLDGGVTPAFFWDNPYPQTFPTFPNLDPSQNNGRAITYVNTHDNRPPTMINVGAEVERLLPGETLVRVAYIGSIGHRMYSYHNLNQIPLQYYPLGQLLNANINSPAAIAAGFTPPYPGFNSSVGQALRPYPQYTTVNNLGSQFSNTNYQSFQINVQRHFGGLTFLGNATLAKLLNMSDPGCSCSPLDSGGMRLQPQSVFNSKLAKSISPVDLAKQMNLSWMWDVPVGRGKRYLTNASSVANHVLGNWRFSAIQTYQGGFPVSLNPAAILVPGQPIQAVNGCGDVHPGIAGQNVYLNKAAFTPTPPFTLANTNVLPGVRGCGYINEDLGLEKGLAFGENVRVTFGAIVLNAFNRHQFIAMTTNVTSSAFGQFNDASYPRSVQLFGRLTF